MSIAEHRPATGDGSGALGFLPWPDRDTIDRMMRSPKLSLRRTGKPDFTIHVDRVRAKPAVSPTLSMNLGVGAIGLGLWGALFPGHVKRTLGVRSPEPVVRALFGARELVTGFTLAANP